MQNQVAKIFMNGHSQAVRLPKEFRFNTDEVYVSKQGDNIILTAKKPSWDDFFDISSSFDSHFLAERDNDLPQERDFF